MNNKLREISTNLGKMSSQEAATWLIEAYPAQGSDYGDAITLLTHRSWKREDQIRLAKHYLKKLPFSSSRVYQAFASFMSIELLVKILKEHLPSERSDINLLMYHLRPVLEEAVKTESDRELVRAFVSAMQ